MFNSADLDEFLHQYMISALWSSTDESDDQGGEPLDKNYSIDDIAPSTVDKMRAECTTFLQENDQYLNGRHSQAGHDFWLTRNRHGCGFWETSDWPETEGEALTRAAHGFGEVNLYVGDDGLIYQG